MTRINRLFVLPQDTRTKAVLASALFIVATSAFAAPHFTDLRRIQPIHGDAAAGAEKAQVCLRAPTHVSQAIYESNSALFLNK